MKELIQHAQLRASIAVNREMLWLYWQIGQSLNNLPEQLGLEKPVLDQLVEDLKREYPSLHSFSRENLLKMQEFATTYSEAEVKQDFMGQLSWQHHLVLLEVIETRGERLRHAQIAFENGWSHSELRAQLQQN